MVSWHAAVSSKLLLYYKHSLKLILVAQLPELFIYTGQNVASVCECVSGC